MPAVSPPGRNVRSRPRPVAGAGLCPKDCQSCAPSRAFANLFGTYAKAFNKACQRTGSLFEKPFRRQLPDHDRYFTALVASIHRNPQEQGFVDNFRSRSTVPVADSPGLWYTVVMDAQALKDEPSAILSDFEGVCLVYLFGSQVEGNLGPMSDCDLVVLVERAASDRAANDRAADGRRIQARLAHELARTLQTNRVDVVLLNRASIELAYAIIAEGELLFEQDIATRVEYEAYVLSRYGDYLPVLRRQREDILRGDDHDRRVRRYRAALGRTERALGQIAATQRVGSD